MLDFFFEIDLYLFNKINQINHSLLNIFFEIVSNKYFFLIPFIFFFFNLIKDSKLRIKKIIFTIITIGFVDYTIYNILKPLLHRLRPCHTLELNFPNKLIGNCGGQFSFFSNHAGNAFALIFCIFLLFEIKNSHKYILIFWAILVCISRVYIGVHYPLDVIFGAFYGILISKLFFNIYNKQIF